jgi:DNA-damage-inducible protein J
MSAKTTMVHVRIDEDLKISAAETLAKFGLTISDAVRILLTRVQEEGGLPAGLTMTPDQHEAWFDAKIEKALAEKGPKRSLDDYISSKQNQLLNAS